MGWLLGCPRGVPKAAKRRPEGDPKTSKGDPWRPKGDRKASPKARGELLRWKKVPPGADEKAGWEKIPTSEKALKIEWQI